MEESHRREAVRNYEKSMPVEWGPCVAGIWELVEKRVVEKERKRKSELMEEGVRRICFKEGGGQDAVFKFEKYEGQTFAAAYLKNLYFAEWPTKQDKCRALKLESFKDFVLRLSDLERVM